MKIDLLDNYFSTFETFEASIRNKTERINFFHTNNPEEVADLIDYSIDFNENIQRWTQHIPEGSVVLDVGCRNADTTLPLAYLAGATGKVFAFDPNPLIKEGIKMNIAANPNINIEFQNVALMEKSGEFPFAYSEGQFNGGPDTPAIHIGNFTTKMILEGINFVEAFQSKINFKDISFIKIDTEGYDCNVIATLAPVIEESRPLIQTEWWCGLEGLMDQVYKHFNYQTYNPDTMEKITLGKDCRIHDLLLIPKERIQ